jgi:hypothetical protein
MTAPSKDRPAFVSKPRDWIEKLGDIVNTAYLDRQL